MALPFLAVAGHSPSTELVGRSAIPRSAALAETLFDRNLNNEAKIALLSFLRCFAQPPASPRAGGWFSRRPSTAVTEYTKIRALLYSRFSMRNKAMPPHLVTVDGVKRCSACGTPFPDDSKPTVSRAFTLHVRTAHAKPLKAEPLKRAVPKKNS